jgi:hypothetical protein
MVTATRRLTAALVGMPLAGHQPDRYASRFAELSHLSAAAGTGQQLSES